MNQSLYKSFAKHLNNIFRMLILVLGLILGCNLNVFSQATIPPQLEFVLNTRGTGLTDFNHWELYVKDGQAPSLTGHLDIPTRYAGYDQFGEWHDLPVTVIASLFASNISSVTIPESIKRIEDNGFGSCTKLTSVVIPNSVTYVGAYAFKGCSSLRSVVLSPKNECSISFTGCDIYKAAYPIGKRELVATIEVPYPIDCIPEADGMIYDSGKTTLYFTPWDRQNLILPSTIETIGPKALAGCLRLKQLRVLSAVPPSVSENSFEDAIISSIIVPHGCKEDYINAPGWSQFASVITEVEARTITLNQSSLNLHKQETEQLTATITGQSPELSLKWSSEDELVAIVNNNGLVKAISEGSTVIKAEYGEVSALCEVIVVPTEVTSIELNYSKAELEVTKTLQLIATVKPETATNKTVNWSSNNPEVATVDGNGLVTAKSIGSAIITASGENTSVSCNIEVIRTLPQYIILNHTSLELYPKGEYQLKARVIPEYTTDKSIQWSTSNENIARVDSQGLVTAISVGNANIIAKCGNISAKCVVEVKSIKPTDIQLNASSITIIGAGTYQLTANVTPTDVLTPISWESSNSRIVEVDEYGFLTSLSAGESTITASVGNLTASCEVTVIHVDPYSLTIEPTSVTLNVGETENLIATVSPENAFNKNVYWDSFDPSIASVDKTGKITALKVGETSIIASCYSAYGTSPQRFIKVKVNPEEIYAEKIILNKDTLNLYENYSKYQLTATILPENSVVKEVHWRTDYEMQAIVDYTGLVEARYAGATNIRASCTNPNGEEIYAKCFVIVSPQPTVQINGQDIKIYEGESYMLSAKVIPEDSPLRTIIWESDDPSIVSVDEDGVIKGVKEGGTFITARILGKKTYKWVNVIPKPSVEISNIFEDRNMEYEIYDLSGTLLFNSRLGNNFMNLFPGIYIVKTGDKVEKMVIR